MSPAAGFDEENPPIVGSGGVAVSESQQSGSRNSMSLDLHHRPDPPSLTPVDEIHVDNGETPILGALEGMPRHPISGEKVKSALPFATLLDLLPGGPVQAFYPTDGRQPLTHGALRRFVSAFSLAPFGLGPGDRVGLALPSGPELGCALLAVAAHAAAVPVNSQGTAAEIETDLREVGAKAVIVLYGGSNDAPAAAAAALGVPLLVAVPSDERCGIFALVPADNAPSQEAGGDKATPPSMPGFSKESLAKNVGISRERLSREPADFKINHGDWTRPDDVALLLFTSGTSGKKKVVPYRLRTLVVGAACIAHSWQLKPEDINLNMMPLFHIGGIARNVFAPVLTGGGVVMCPGFDPNMFWDILDDGMPATWYYASPTMHQAYVEEARRRAKERPAPKLGIRMIANAAGALLPALAADVQATFHCTVLPGYGMTECMPISAPPLDYKLDRKGSSGRAVGPEVAILDGAHKACPTGEVGNISVRGAPLFDGYEGNEAANAESFNAQGFFNTGDLGYLDADGYLYITGRSKEVINRGGEIVSPFEVEEAMVTHPDLHQVLCFAQPHNTLQETIGIAVVMQPGRPRPDLRAVQKFAAKSLHPSKWPQVLVYMAPRDAASPADVPRGEGSGKPQRAKFAERAEIPEICEGTPEGERMLEAVAPPKGAPMSVKFGHTQVAPRLARAASLTHEIGSASKYGVRAAVAVVREVKRGRQGVVAYVAGGGGAVDASALLEEVREETYKDGSLHGYEVPEVIIPCDVAAVEAAKGGDDSQLPDPIEVARAAAAKGRGAKRGGQLEERVAATWARLLDLGPGEEIPPGATFFEAGGSSLMAGQLAARMRKDFGIAMGVGDVFGHPTVEAMAALVGDRTKTNYSREPAATRPGRTASDQSKLAWSSTSAESRGVRSHVSSDDVRVGRPPPSPTSPFALILQLLPLVFWAPVRRMLVWIVFVRIWALLLGANKSLGSNSRGVSLFMTLAAVRILARTFMPLVGIALKWLIMGRYKAGKYQLWGGYYLRWWTTQQLLAIMGKGFFSSHPAGLRLYYRLLGAKIGEGASISPKAKLGEFDLLEIGEGALIDGKSTVRPFALDRGRMVLQPVSIGARCTVGVMSTIAPGARVPSDTYIGPLSSSYELEDAHEDNKRSCRPAFPGPSPLWRLLGMGIVAFVRLVGWSPVFSMLIVLTQTRFYSLHTITDDPRDILQWFSTWERVLFYLAIRIVNKIVCPWVYLGAVIFVKRAVVGKFEAGPRDQRGGWGTLRHWIMAELLPDGSLGGVGPLLGKHYEAVSWCYRALGAKVGKRVYWPGSGVACTEHDLLSVGDDAVFGSRSVAIPCDALEAAPIVIGAGCFVADRCVLLPGAELGRCATLGSGGLAPRGFKAPPGSTWVGSKGRAAEQLGAGDESALTGDTVRPFGRAFYRHEGFKAPYFVLPEWAVILYHHAWFAFCGAVRAAPLVLALLAAREATAGKSFLALSFAAGTLRVALLFAAIYFVFNVLSVMGCVGIKWALLGRRTAGKHTWDADSYCQRWQMYLCAEELRRGVGFGGRGVLDYLTGSAYIASYFRLLGADIGQRCCLYPNGGDPMMTEPDLVTLRDGVCVDDASVICHLNTNGEFSLNALHIGAGATLRSFSRLLSGAAMEERARLLEHTLVYSGDVVDAGSTWQGWPSQCVGWDLAEVQVHGGQEANKVP